MDLRPAESRPVDGPALHVLSPDPDRVEDARWLHSLLGAGAWVYPADVQWRTAKAVFGAGAIRAPEGLRDLIESVHGGMAAALPEPLQRVGWETEGRAMSEAGQARTNMPVPADGYDQPHMQKVYDDEVFPTRLGRAQITLRLARIADGALRPLTGAGRFGWRMSEVEISRSRYAMLAGVDQDAPEIAALKKDWPVWMRDRVIVAPVDADGNICAGLRYDAETGVVFS